MPPRVPSDRPVTPESLWRAVYWERWRLQVLVWVAAAIAALGFGATFGPPTVIRVAVAGAGLGLLAPWASAQLAGGRLRGAVVALSWHLRRFRPAPDRSLASSDPPRSDRAAAVVEPEDAWSRFERARLNARHLLGSDTSDATMTEMRSAATGLTGVARMRADAEIAVLEAAAIATAGGDWVAHLAPVGDVVRDDRDYGPRTRLAALILGAGISALVVGVGSAVLGIVLIGLRN